MSLDGHLRDFDILFIVRSMIAQDRATRLFLASETEDGEIFVAGGKVLDARIGDVSGLESLFKLLSWRDGSFHLTQAEEVFTESIGLTWSAVLREAFSRAAAAEDSSADRRPEAGNIANSRATPRVRTEAAAETPDENPTETPAPADDRGGADSSPSGQISTRAIENNSADPGSFDPESLDSDSREDLTESPVGEPPTEEVEKTDGAPKPSQLSEDSAEGAETEIGPRQDESDGKTSMTGRFAIDASISAEKQLLDLLPRLEHEAVLLSNADRSEGPHVALRTIARLIRFVRSNPTPPNAVDTFSEIAQPINSMLEGLGLPLTQAPSGDMLVSAYHGCELGPDARRRSLLAAARALLEITALHFQSLTSTFGSADEKLQFRAAYQTVLADLEHRISQAPI